VAAVSVPIVVVALVLAGPGLLSRATRSHRAPLGRIVRWLSDQASQVRRGLRVFTRPGLGAGAIAAQLAAWAVQTLAAYAVLFALNLQGKAGVLLQAVEITTAILLGVPALLGERISLKGCDWPRRVATRESSSRG
jgi:phosphatidylinositol alpha-mannosyltransferase